VSSVQGLDENQSPALTIDEAAAHIFQLAKLRGILHSERARSDQLVQGLKNELRVAMETLTLERERRAQELKRALLEGVKFFVHSKNSYASLKGDCTYYIRYHGFNKMFSLHRKHGLKAKGIHQFHIANMAYATVGTKHFTLGMSKDQDAKENTKAKGSRAQQIRALQSSKCLSIIFSTTDQAKENFDKLQRARQALNKARQSQGQAPVKYPDEV
jgi:hypothetical protein